MRSRASGLTISWRGISRAVLLFVVFVGAASTPAGAQQSSAEELAQANNPLADMKAFNFHNYYMPKLYGVDDEVANTSWFRYAQPIGRVLVRASLPLVTVPVSGQADAESGLGDFNVFGAYLAVNEPTTTVGIGPLLTVPTATNDALGSGKWQVGAAAVAFLVPSPQVQVGGLVTWQASFAGDANRSSTNFMAVQPFALWQLGGGTYLRSTGIWAFNLETGDYNVPFGLGIGQVAKVGGIVFNIFGEPQFTVLHDGQGQPAVQLFFGLNMQFVGS